MGGHHYAHRFVLDCNGVPDALADTLEKDFPDMVLARKAAANGPYPKAGMTRMYLDISPSDNAAALETVLKVAPGRG